MSSTRDIRVVRPGDDIKTVFAAGDEYRCLSTGDDTDGRYFLIEAIVPPGGGPPAHIHSREEEAFYVLEGELTFYGDNGEIAAGPGTHLNIPKGARHWFRNNTEENAKMLFFFAPAGIEGLFDEFSQLDLGDPGISLDVLNELGRKYGIEYLAD